MSEAIVADAALTKIVRDIFTIMASLPVAPANADAVPAGATAFVGLSGPERKFIVVVQTTETLACRLCAGMLGAPVSDWSGDVSDALGEIANMTAGNVKTALGIQGLTCSMPTVVRGKSYEWASPGMSVLKQIGFVSGGDPFTVCVGESRI